MQPLQTNRIPPELRESMQEHLRLHFDTQDASDEQVHIVWYCVLLWLLLLVVVEVRCSADGQWGSLPIRSVAVPCCEHMHERKQTISEPHLPSACRTKCGLSECGDSSHFPPRRCCPSSPPPSAAASSRWAPVQHSTAQHSTAQHDTVQLSTARHSTAQRSTVHHAGMQNAIPRSAGVCISQQRSHAWCSW